MIIYRELEDYIYEYCKEYVTQDEFMAHKVRLYKTPNTSEAMIARMRERGWFNCRFCKHDWRYGDQAAK